MEQAEFWDLMRTLGPRPDDDDFDRLKDHLATRGPADIIDFEDRLAALLYALDTPAHASAARAHNDWFLYVRCAAVTAGPDAYAKILADPRKLKRFARREAELLLTVASAAYERSTGGLWEHESPLSYESGSNHQAWGDPEPPTWDQPRAQWLTLRATVFLPGGWPAAYIPLIHHIEQALLADPTWQTWWSAANIPECHLSLTFLADGFGEQGTTVKVGHTRVEAGVSGPPDPFPSKDPRDLLPRAQNDVTALLNAVRIKLDLDPLPPVTLPDLPADLPHGTDHPDTFTEILGGRSVLKVAGSMLLNRFRKPRP